MGRGNFSSDCQNVEMITQKVRGDSKTKLAVEITAGATESFEKSKEAIKQFTSVLLTNILYERSILPKNIFMDAVCEGCPIKVIKDKSSDLGARAVMRWLQGANDAIDKGYLQTFVLSVEHIEKIGEPLEKYHFKYFYNVSENPKIVKEVDVRSQTEYFLQLTQKNLNKSLQPLPPPTQLHLNVYMTHYADVTPSEYRPPNFHETKQYVTMRVPGSQLIQLGRWKTPFHKVVVRSEGCQGTQVNHDHSYFEDSQKDDSQCIEVEDSFEDGSQDN